MSDLENLCDMGFEREKAVLALKHGGSLQNAIDWLDKNADKSVDELQQENSNASGDYANEEGAPVLAEGETAKSLVCNECSKRFRSPAQAEFHAGRSGHTDFSESTEEIAPLTEEEKAAKLAELRERATARKAAQGAQDEVERRRNEEIRRKNTKEVSDAKEELARKEQVKEAMAKRREKQAEVEARKRVQAKIAADREERRRRAELDKAQREGQTFPTAAVESSLPAAVPAPRPAESYVETRLRLQTPSGAVVRSFAVDTTLFEVAHAVQADKGLDVQLFQSTYPKKSWDRSDFGVTLKEAGLVPSAALIVR